MSLYVLRTLGCKANTFDSLLIVAELKRRGWQPFAAGFPAGSENVRLCLINSCTVTDEADRQTRKLAARLRREFPRAEVVVTGCGAEVDPERLAHSKGISYVIGNRDKPRLVSLVLEKLTEVRDSETGLGTVLGIARNYADMASRHPIDREWPSVADFGFEYAEPGTSARTRAFLKIQEGCNSFCTYCVIPYGRGPARSLEPDAVIEQVRGVEERGFREVVITGTNIGDYGSDLGVGIEAVVQRILDETGIPRIRLGSLDPTEITPELLRLMSSERRLCPHFHISLQSPNDRVLKRMKRRYGIQEIRDCLEKVARLEAPGVPIGGVFVGMDVITGFPGETEEMFGDSVAVLKSLRWSRLHVFPYSERAGTPATRLPGSVPKPERARRSHLLNQLSLERMKANAEEILKLCSESPDRVISDVLIEGGANLEGYSRNYLRVAVRRGAPNEVVSVHPSEFVIDSRAGDVCFIAK